jgi:hypothetical protein
MNRALLATFILLGMLTVWPGARVGHAGSAAAPRDEKGKIEPKKDQATPKSVELNLLEKNAGANFGNWAVWRFDEGVKALVLVNQKTGYAIYLPWSSNGWVNYRTKEGAWHVVFHKGEPELQDRKDLKIAPFLGKRPTDNLEVGKYSFEGTEIVEGKKVVQRWTVKVTKEYLDFHNASYDDRLTIRRSTGEATHNGRTIAGKQ